jgi:hypothetical protein
MLKAAGALLHHHLHHLWHDGLPLLRLSCSRKELYDMHAS